MTYARHIAVVLTILAGTSCATYQLGPRPADADEVPTTTAEPVAVETVATPAEWAMDAGRLTRTLVDHLADRGIAAEWTDGTEASATVHCSADGPPPTAFRANRAAHADLRCRVDAASAASTLVTTRGSAVAGAPVGGRFSLGDAASTAMREATADALEQAAPQIADALTRQSSTSEAD